MTLICDSREKSGALKAGCDGVRLLKYGDRNESYDFLILRRWEPLEVRVERKRWSDFVGSSFSAGHKMERQMGAVDVLLVELPTPGERRGWDRERERLAEEAWKRLARYALGFPVIISPNEKKTLEILRYLETKQDLQIRAGSIVGTGVANPLAGLLRGCGVNPERPAGDGLTLLEAVSGLVDKEALVASLRLDTWGDIHGLGPGLMARIRGRLDAM